MNLSEKKNFTPYIDPNKMSLAIMVNGDDTQNGRQFKSVISLGKCKTVGLSPVSLIYEEPRVHQQGTNVSSYRNRYL